MGEPLLALVEECLLPSLAPRGFSIVHSDVSMSFGNAVVTLHAPRLRIRVVRERGLLFADFGSSATPLTWFDSAVIMDYLGLSAAAGFHDRNARVVLAGVAAFVGAFQAELELQFSPARLASTMTALNALRSTRASMLFDTQ